MSTTALDIIRPGDPQVRHQNFSVTALARHHRAVFDAA